MTGDTFTLSVHTSESLLCACSLLGTEFAVVNKTGVTSAFTGLTVQWVTSA